MKRHRKLSNAGKVYNNSYNLICSKMFDSFIATRAIKIRSREIFNGASRSIVHEMFPQSGKTRSKHGPSRIKQTRMYYICLWSIIFRIEIAFDRNQ